MLPPTCEVDFVRSNMDIHVEEVLLLDDIPASSWATDRLKKADLVCCAAVMYLQDQRSCEREGALHWGGTCHVRNDTSFYSQLSSDSP